jgi:hypothetical protein
MEYSIDSVASDEQEIVSAKGEYYFAEYERIFPDTFPVFPDRTVILDINRLF